MWAYLTKNKREESCEITAVEWCPCVEVLRKKERDVVSKNKTGRRENIRKVTAIWRTDPVRPVSTLDQGTAQEIQTLTFRYPTKSTK